MDHIEFDFYEDFTCPLMHFLERCGISVTRNSTNIHFPKYLFNCPIALLKASKKPVSAQVVETLNGNKFDLESPKNGVYNGRFKIENKKSIINTGNMSARESTSSLVGF